MIESPEAAATAAELESNNKFGDAAQMYLQAAATRIGTSLNDPETDPSTLGLALPELMRAIYCARRANNPPIASALGQIFHGTLGILLEVTHNTDIETTAAELTGDVHLMLESPDAIAAYDNAAQTYDTLDIGSQASIAFEPEIERAHDVVCDYLNWKNIEFPDETPNGDPLNVDLKARTEFKRNLATQLEEDTTG